MPHSTRLFVKAFESPFQKTFAFLVDTTILDSHFIMNSLKRGFSNSFNLGHEAWTESQMEKIRMFIFYFLVWHLMIYLGMGKLYILLFILRTWWTVIIQIGNIGEERGVWHTRPGHLEAQNAWSGNQLMRWVHQPCVWHGKSNQMTTVGYHKTWLIKVNYSYNHIQYSHINPDIFSLSLPIKRPYALITQAAHNDRQLRFLLVGDVARGCSNYRKRKQGSEWTKYKGAK